MADEPVPAADPPAKTRKTAEAVPDPGWPSWRYTGTQRIYTNVPVTVDDGDVIVWPDIPSHDGAWTPTTGPATKRPDNYRPEE